MLINKKIDTIYDMLQLVVCNDIFLMYVYLKFIIESLCIRVFRE
jgi:hypothetical protein